MPNAGDWTGAEYWMRCPHCGDSDHHSTKAHYSINVVKGKFNCYRCGTSGSITEKNIYKITGELPLPSVKNLETTEGKSWEELLPSIQPGPGSSRKTSLDRFHLTLADGRLVDVFLMKETEGDLVGLQLRASWEKSMKTMGQRDFMYSGNNLFELVEDHEYLRLVEGPYDCQYPNDVAVMGMPSFQQMRKLRGLPLMLCPDGDIWEDKRKFQAYFRPLLRSSNWIYGIEFIPDGLDPDEVPAEDREPVTVKQLRKMMNLATGRGGDSRLPLLSI